MSCQVEQELSGKLSTGVDTRDSKVGDRVEVEVDEDVKTGGRIRLEKGSTVMDKVTQVTTFSGGKQSAKLELVFNGVASKGREQTPTHLISPQPQLCVLQARRFICKKGRV